MLFIDVSLVGLRQRRETLAPQEEDGHLVEVFTRANIVVIFQQLLELLLQSRMMEAHIKYIYWRHYKTVFETFMTFPGQSKLLGQEIHNILFVISI